MTKDEFPSFWRWLVTRDRDGDIGLSNVLNAWLLVHLIVAGTFGLLLEFQPSDFGIRLAIPGAAILVGLSFAWAGRSASLFQDKEFSKFIIKDGAPVEGYLYSFQLAILTVLVFLLVTFFVVAGGFGGSTGNDNLDDEINRAYIIFFGSLALRECWGAIAFVNKLTIQFYAVREQEIAQEEAEKPVK